MDIGSLYNVLIGEVARQTNTSTSVSRNSENQVSFGDILAAVSNKDTVSAQNMFSAAFSDYTVEVKTGDSDVTAPKTGYREMIVTMPDSLREKMEADPKYAWEIVEKVQKYKTDYDRTDNALAVTYGYNQTLHQISKSYCVSLDENGDIKSCQVAGGMLNAQKTGQAQAQNISKSNNNRQIERRFATTSKRRSSSVQTTPTDAFSLWAMNTDYLNTASYFAPSYIYNNNLRNLSSGLSSSLDSLLTSDMWYNNL